MMEEYIEQPQQVADNPYEFPTYFFAGFWIRFFAFLVDMICISAISTIVINIFSIGYPLAEQTGALSVSNGIKLIVYLGYFILLTKLNKGQTIGKMIFGLQVISMDEIQLSWATVLVREGACRFILKTPLLAVGYVVAAFTHRKQHVGDLFSQTSVVALNVVKASKNK
ncbi:RDD family protein [Vagococcus carniphilus]|uniref:RDD family protein n=1 Tax=Vagococcus carniphilus TaxID=218144 RepID=UPI00288DDE0F|nr:RDD family protein [Vagococcus carniphilus]MDT2815201.1 RDD family protein [Vagococcus carniphilus]MDT2831105.1 RDD family protein [Vagococcus carniphilus]MDT2839736.1 RDD family protein [Vagococcus carniphilus]MDT2854205.1 RDD family protein [Vagococcus carniphilus]